MSDTAPPDPARDSESAREHKRSRNVIILTTFLTVLVMGGVVTLGLIARGGDEPADTSTARWGDPYRQVPWEDEDCKPDPAHPPKLVFDLPPEGLEFGAVKQGVELQRDVVFHNEGSGPLCIRDVQSPCGCIHAKLVGDVKKLQPNESGKIAIRLATEGKDGEQSKRISVYTNALDPPVQTFLVHASISQGLVVTPSHVTVPSGTKGEPMQFRVRFRSAADDADWKITGVEGSVLVNDKPVPYTWRIDPIEVPGHHALDVVITHPGRDQEGPFQDNVKIRTTHPDRPEVTVIAHFVVVPPLVAYPQNVVLGYDLKRPFPIRLVPANKNVPFAVTDVTFEAASGTETPRGGLGFEAKKVQDEHGTWTVTVSYDGLNRAPDEQLRATMVVKTTYPGAAEVRVPCSATIPPE